MLDRREFHRSAVAFGAMAALAPAARPLGANDRVRLAFIGVGNRGDQLLDAFLSHADAEVVAVCDAYQPYLGPAREKAGGKADTLSDYRRVLDRKDVDAVVIATPDHWHALQFVDACHAGKDVYVEKPASLTIAEGRRMCDVARESGRVTTVGLHRRSNPAVREAVELVRSGAVGKVTVARGFHLKNESPMGIGSPPDGPPPEGLDWDLWLGPAAKVPYNPNRCLYKFRWFWDYSGGQLTNFGTHYLDVIQWALGQDAPKSVACFGGKFAVDDNRQIPDTLEATWEYDGCLVTFSQFNANASPGNARGWELEFRGTSGTMLMQESKGYEVVPEKVRAAELPTLSPIARKANAAQNQQARPARKPAANGNDAPSTTLHARNFLDCVKSRAATHCPIEVGHRSTTATLLAKVALARRQRLDWDAAAERVTNDPGANDLLSYRYREPYKLG